LVTQIWIAKDLGFLDDHGPLQIEIFYFLADRGASLQIFHRIS